MLKIICIAVAVLALLFTSQASAHDPYIGGSLRIAQTYWHGAVPTCAPVEVVDGEAREDMRGYADPAFCRITLHGGWIHSGGNLELCETIVHEYGHLLGFGHDYPDPMMNPASALGGITDSGCRTLSLHTRHHRWHVHHPRKNSKRWRRAHRRFHRQLRDY